MARRQLGLDSEIATNNTLEMMVREEIQVQEPCPPCATVTGQLKNDDGDMIPPKASSALLTLMRAYPLSNEVSSFVHCREV